MIPGPLAWAFIALASIVLYVPFSLHVTLGQDYLPRHMGTASGVTLGLAVSVGSVDERVWRSVEPGTPRPRSRLDVVRAFADRGLDCTVLMAPILPGLTDSAEQIDATAGAIAAAGARRLTPVVLHLRPGAREWYRDWLTREYPYLLPLYRELYGNGSYAPAAYRKRIAALVREAAERHGLTGPGNHRNGSENAPGSREPEPAQLSLPW